MTTTATTEGTLILNDATIEVVNMFYSMTSDVLVMIMVFN